MFLLMIVGLLTVGICHGLSIDVMESDSSNSRNPPVKIICQFSTQELQNGNNKIAMTHEGLDLADCDGNAMTCTTASKKLNATIDKGKSVLTIKDMDVFYSGNTWGCILGTQKAFLKLKYFRVVRENLSEQLISQISIVEVLILVVVLLILIIQLMVVCRSYCCQRKRSSSGKDDDTETWNCCPCLFGTKEPENKGYTGKKYEVRTSYNIEDPNHVPDAKFKDGTDRKKEAKRAAENYGPEKKAAATEKLTEWTEARKPLVSVSEENEKKV